jgi:hypothetical protein
MRVVNMNSKWQKNLPRGSEIINGDTQTDANLESLLRYDVTQNYRNVHMLLDRLSQHNLKMLNRRHI